MVVLVLVTSTLFAAVCSASTAVNKAASAAESGSPGIGLMASSVPLLPAGQPICATSTNAPPEILNGSATPVGRQASTGDSTDHRSSTDSASRGTITVTGRAVYENIVTDDQNVLPESPRDGSGKYANNMNNLQCVFGYPDASSISICFSKIDIESGYDHIYVKTESGTLVWQTDTGYNGEKIYENLWIDIPGHVAQIHMTSDGSITYWGYNVFLLVPDANIYRGAKYATVEVWDHDPWPGNDDLLWTGLTDANGYFTASGISNSDSGGSGGQDVFVKFKPTSDYARVIAQYGGEYNFDTMIWDNRPDGSTLDVGWWWSALTNYNTAWTIYDALTDSYSYLKDGPAGWTAPQVKAVWTIGHNSDYLCGNNGALSHYHTTGLYSNEIHLTSANGQVTDIVQHEYGHHAMWHVYGNWAPSNGGSHTWTGNVDAGLAWLEGWADFFVAAVGVGGGHGDGYYGESFQGTSPTDCVAFAYEPSGEHYNPSAWVLGGAGWPGGVTNEGAIAYALYDVFDTASDGKDICSAGFASIWNVLLTGHQANFGEWWTAFKNMNVAMRNHEAKSAIYQGSAATIDYNSNPSVGGGIEVLTAPTNGWYHGTLSLRVQNTADADSEDYGYFSGSFQYQKGGGGWVQIYSFNNWGTWTTNWNTVPPGDGAYQLKVSVTDGIESAESVYGSTVYVDNTAPGNPTTHTSSHTEGAWSSDNTVYVSWSGASDSGGSGLWGYSYVWDNAGGTVPDATIETTGTSMTSSALADGTWYFHVRSVDIAGNGATGAHHAGPYKIDTTAPWNPTSFTSSHQVNVPNVIPIVQVTWLGAGDSGSGIAGYSIVWDQSSGTVPDTTIDTTSTSSTSSLLAIGSWYLHVRSIDNVAIPASGAYHIGPFVIIADTGPSTPSPLTVASGDERDGVFTLHWTNSVDNDQTPVAGYYLIYYPPGGPDWVILDDDIIPSVTSYDISYRGPGTYLYSVCAFDSANPPLWSGWASKLLIIPWDSRMTTDSAASNSPTIAVDASENFHVVWSDARDGNYEIYYKKVDANWNVLVADTRLTVDAADSINPAIAVSPSGYVSVIWSDNRDSVYSIYTKIYTPGSGWGADTRLAYVAGTDFKEPDVAVDSAGQFNYAYRATTIVSGVVTETIRYYSPGGSETTIYTYSDTYMTGATHDHLECPRIAVGMTTGILHVVFGKGPQYPVEGGTSYVLYTRYVSGAWETTQTLGTTVDVPRRCAIDTDQSTGVYVVWDNWYAGSFQVFYRKSANSGASWGSTIVFGDASNHQSFPDIAVGSSGQVYIVWRDSSYGNYEISMVKSTDYGVNFGPIVRLTSATGDSMNPRICVSSSGKVGIAWTDYRNSNWEIYFTAKYL